MTAVKSANGVEGCLIRGHDGTYYFRVYDADHNFRDYDANICLVRDEYIKIINA